MNIFLYIYFTGMLLIPFILLALNWKYKWKTQKNIEPIEWSIFFLIMQIWPITLLVFIFWWLFYVFEKIMTKIYNKIIPYD
jgi:hypothetical protein